MPEIKHNFTKGKMNKDLDERLIPNGEYRDAMNIQVSTSEGSDVGTIQNILGNFKVNDQRILDNFTLTCVGSISDEKNDKLYWMVAGTTSTNSEFNILPLLDTAPLNRKRVDYKDMILEYNNANNATAPLVKPVIVDIYNISIPRSTGFTASPNISTPNTLNNFVNSSGIIEGMVLEGYDTSGIIIYSAIVVSVSGGNVLLSQDVYNDFFNIEWFVFSRKRVLNFKASNNITGINIIDDFLLWCDGI